MPLKTARPNCIGKSVEARFEIEFKQFFKPFHLKCLKIIMYFILRSPTPDQFEQASKIEDRIQPKKRLLESDRSIVNYLPNLRATRRLLHSFIRLSRVNSHDLAQLLDLLRYFKPSQNLCVTTELWISQGFSTLPARSFPTMLRNTHRVTLNFSNCTQYP